MISPPGNNHQGRFAQQLESSIHTDARASCGFQLPLLTGSEPIPIQGWKDTRSIGPEYFGDDPRLQQTQLPIGDRYNER